MHKCPFCDQIGCISTYQEDDRLVHVCGYCDASWYRIIKEK